MPGVPASGTAVQRGHAEAQGPRLPDLRRGSGVQPVDTPATGRWDVARLHRRTSALPEYAAAFATRKMHNGEWKPQSRLIHDRMVRNLDLFGLADKPIGKITEADIVAWVHWLKTEANLGKGLSPNTIDGTVGQLRAVLAYAVANRDLTVNVARGTDVKLPKVTGRHAAVREEEVPTDDQLDHIRAELPERYRLLVSLGAEVGLRSGEAQGLRVRNFHALKRRVEVVQQLVDDPARGTCPHHPRRRRTAGTCR